MIKSMVDSLNALNHSSLAVHDYIWFSIVLEHNEITYLDYLELGLAAESNIFRKQWACLL